VVELRRLADNATPVAADLRDAAPSLNGAIKKLGPFATEANTALKSLADETEEAAPDLVDSDPVILQIRDLAKQAQGGAKALDKLLASLRETGGYDELAKFIFNGAGTFNGFDSYGHYLRGELLVTNCVDYRVEPLSGCSSNWAGGSASGSAAGIPSGLERLLELGPGPGPGDGGAGAAAPKGGQAPAPLAPEQPQAPGDIAPEGGADQEPGEGPGSGGEAGGDELGAGEEGAAPQADEGNPTAERRRARMRDARALLEFLMGDGP
jgi:hypothetical protein